MDTDGSFGRYLSDINVREGLRLLEYSTDMRAQPGAGLLFDFLKADVSNAGGDQSQTFSLRMDKTRAYRFEGSVRRFNYYRSPGPNFALGLRDYDLRQQVSDFNLKLFPQRAIRINAGYGRSVAVIRRRSAGSRSRAFMWTPDTTTTTCFQRRTYDIS